MVFKKGQKSWNEGKHTPEKTKLKIALALKGKHNSPETEFKKGVCRGSCPKDVKAKVSKANKKIFNDLLGVKTIGVIKSNKLSETMKKQYKSGERIHSRGMLVKSNKWGKHTNKTKKLISNALKLNPNRYWLNKKRDDKTINKIKESRANQIIPLEDTTIEIKIQNFLKELGIEHLTHFYISEILHRYRCDIFIPVQNCILQKTVIECDGNYWHGNTKFYDKNELNKKQTEQKWRDEIRTKELIEKGFIVIRLWEREIKSMDLNNLKNRINI